MRKFSLESKGTDLIIALGAWKAEVCWENHFCPEFFQWDQPGGGRVGSQKLVLFNRQNEEIDVFSRSFHCGPMDVDQPQHVCMAMLNF